MCELPRRSYPININSTDWGTQIWRMPIFGKGCDVRWRTHLMIRDTYDLRVIIVRVTQCQSRYLFRENFLLGLFHSKENIVTIDNLYLFFNSTHKHLVICFVVKEFELRPLDDCRIVISFKYDTSSVALLARASTFRRSSVWRGFLLINPRQDCSLRSKLSHCLKIVQKICVPVTAV